MNLPPPQQDALLARARRLLSDHRARARKDGATLDYGLPQLMELLAGNPTCAYCRAPVAWDASIDHRTPTGRGGKHALENLAVVCKRCNLLKGCLTEPEFREVLTLLALLHPTARADVERRLTSGGQVYAGKRKAPSALPATPAEAVKLAKAEIEVLKARLARKEGNR
jgi:5-methylcytosine-specific restriction endonuclease McrA